MGRGNMRNSQFFPDNQSVWDQSLKGQIHYRFNTTPYIVFNNYAYGNMLNRLCLVIASRDKLSVGLEYNKTLQEAPTVIFKETGDSNLIENCKKRNIHVEYNARLAEYIYSYTELDEEIPFEKWNDVALLFVSLSKKNEVIKKMLEG